MATSGVLAFSKARLGFSERPEGLFHAVGCTPAVEGQHASGSARNRSVTMGRVKLNERVDVPRITLVAMQIGEPCGNRCRAVVTLQAIYLVVPVTSELAPVLRARVPMMPVVTHRNHRCDQRVPPAVGRLQDHRGMGTRHRAMRQHGSERDPRGSIPGAVPVMEPAIRLDSTADREHGYENECCKPHHAFSTTKWSRAQHRWGSPISLTRHCIRLYRILTCLVQVSTRKRHFRPQARLPPIRHAPPEHPVEGAARQKRRPSILSTGKQHSLK